jgi:hypothetical protein
MPNIPRSILHSNDVSGGSVRRIEEQEKHFGGGLRKEGEVDARLGECRPTRVKSARLESAIRSVLKT